jgi:transcriptional regulator with XRE-family HTH domain
VAGYLRRGFANRVERQAAIDEVLRLHGEGWTQGRIAAEVGISQPTVHLWLQKNGPVRHSLQARIASEIRRELVCCDIYQRFMDVGDAGRQHELKASAAWHDICFYGEWAARITEGVAK